MDKCLIIAGCHGIRRGVYMVTELASAAAATDAVPRCVYGGRKGRPRTASAAAILAAPQIDATRAAADAVAPSGDGLPNLKFKSDQTSPTVLPVRI